MREVMEIPYGTRDFLPAEAAEKRALEEVLAELFSRWGYDEVVTPTVEYLETLTKSSGAAMEPKMFKLFDGNNRTLALRHEMTTPLARLASSRLREEPLPLKLSYISSVFRYEQTQTGRQCEFYQAGVELMGSSATEADAEILALAIRGLLTAGLKSFTVCLGQVDFVAGLMEQYQLSEELQQELKAALEVRDLVAYETRIENLHLMVAAKGALSALPQLSGGEEILSRAYSMAVSERSRRALDNLSEIYRLLKAYGVAEYVRFDLGIIRDFSYYTGMVFEVYTPTLGFPLCGGGRYDRLLKEFGSACPATGFAMGIERILLALSREGVKEAAKRRDVYVSFVHGKAEEAIQEAMQLRDKGEVTCLAVHAESKTEAEAMCVKKGFERLVYIE